MNFHFVFCHGWGMDARIWDPLAPFFKDSICSFMDLGYFGARNSVDIEQIKRSSSSLIGIGHSLGLRKLLALDLSFKALIGLNSFIDFLGNDPFLRLQRHRELNALTHYFTRDPVQTLLSFYQKCDSSPQEMLSFETMDQVKLRQDLQDMTGKLPVFPLVPILILGALDDVIVPPTLIKDNFQDQSWVNLQWHPTGGHLLGQAEPELVYNYTRDFLKAVGKK